MTEKSEVSRDLDRRDARESARTAILFLEDFVLGSVITVYITRLTFAPHHAFSNGRAKKSSKSSSSSSSSPAFKLVLLLQVQLVVVPLTAL